jgi:dienelactone hydrolase
METEECMEFKIQYPGYAVISAGVCGGILAILVGAQIASPALAQKVPAEDTRNTHIVTTNTPMPLPAFTNRQSWEARKVHLRNQILVSAGLSPMPEKTPLNPQVFGKIEGQGYTIEKVLLETLPGFYLGGNLYRPLDGRTKHPAILNPHGHWPYGRLENEQIDSGPALGISLARQGYVAFAYDMVGYTDTIQIPHRFGSSEMRLWSFGPLGLQLWDSIRALDFLATLPDVDPGQLGVVGASGGATQSFLLAAVDDRIQFDSLVNMVSAIMQGGDLCENAPGLRFNTSNVEFAAMMAPKPMLLVSDTTDWTRNLPKEEYPAIKKIYDLYGRGDQVHAVQFEAVHNFNLQSREAVYDFLAQLNPGLSDGRELKEHNIAVPMLQQMLALSDRTLPADALDLSGLFHLWRAMAAKQNGQMPDASLLKERLQQTLEVENPRGVIAETNGPSIVLSRPERGDRVPGIWIEGRGEPAIVIDPEGSSAALNGDVVARLRNQRRPLLLLDVFQTGAAKAPRTRADHPPIPVENAKDESEIEREADDAAGPMFLTYNLSDDAARVQDILTAISYLHTKSPTIELDASGDAALWATLAASVSVNSVDLHVSDEPRMSSDEDYLIHLNVPGILRAGGLSAAQYLVRERTQAQ